jgi:hypothetical protein
MAGRFDAVVTCFFIDTAHNILEYLEVGHCTRLRSRASGQQRQEPAAGQASSSASQLQGKPAAGASGAVDLPAGNPKRPLRRC